jgi:predicted nucleotidyltransferase
MEHMNVFYDKQNTDVKYKLMLYIVDNFTQAIQDVCLFVNNDERKEFIKQFKPIIDNYQKEDICLADNLPTYDYREIGISEKSYKILIKFFSSIKNLKSVWIHGSRAYNAGTYASDIDIIIDCPEEKYDDIVNQLNNLSVPYWFDCKNLYNSTYLNYLKITQIIGTKKNILR